MAYRFIDENQEVFGLRWLLRHMGICPNAYYNYRKDTKAEYRASEAETCQQIKEIYHEFGGIIGHRAMRIFLARKGIILSKATIHKYMNKELHLHCECRRKRPGYKRSHKHKIFPDGNCYNRKSLKSNQCGFRILNTSQ